MPASSRLLVFSFVVASLSGTVRAADTRPHIVVILVDDMGYGDPGCYNADSKIPTPHIDALADSGMKFTDAHASGPLCHLSRYGLLTGRYPFRAPVHQWRTQPTIKNDQPTIASFLKSTGYHTVMVGKWHLGFQENGYDKPLPGGPVDRGFDQYFGIRASTDIPPYFYIRGNQAVQPPTDHIEANNSEGWSPIQGAFWRAGGIAPDLQLKDVLPRFTSEAVTEIEDHAAKQSDDPLFLYLAYPAPHTPWLPSEKYRGRSGADMYGDFMMEVDAQVGTVMKALETAGMSEQTMVIFSSDNGPTWYENDVVRFGHDCSGGLRGMKSDAWECGHRVPFIVRWPGKVAKAAESDRLISFVDLFATLADLQGRPLAATAAPDSFSFAAELLGKNADADEIRPSLPLQSGGGHRTMRRGPWKLILGLGSGGFSVPRKRKPEPGEPPGQLYNLDLDPAEERNLYAEHPEIVESLTSELVSIEAAESHRKLALAESN
jgi:arylsulfatase A-like enzyme